MRINISRATLYDLSVTIPPSLYSVFCTWSQYFHPPGVRKYCSGTWLICLADFGRQQVLGANVPENAGRAWLLNVQVAAPVRN